MKYYNMEFEQRRGRGRGEENEGDLVNDLVSISDKTRRDKGEQIQEDDESNGSDMKAVKHMYEEEEEMIKRSVQ